MSSGSIYPINKKPESSKTNQSTLSASTKDKLEELGISTDNILTEMQGQIALKDALAEQEKLKNQSNPIQLKPEEALKLKSKMLANELKIQISSDADTSKILGAVSSKINSLRQSKDPNNIALATNYQLRYSTLSKQLQDYIAEKTEAEAKLNNSMEALARYNKLGLKIE